MPAPRNPSHAQQRERRQSSSALDPMDDDNPARLASSCMAKLKETWHDKSTTEKVLDGSHADSCSIRR
jgi:hypothetical protein